MADAYAGTRLSASIRPDLLLSLFAGLTLVAAGFEMPVAVGTSLLVIAINSAAALAARLGGHLHLPWPLLGVFTVAALAGALAGNRVASRLDAARLTAAFTILLITVAAYSLTRSLPGLV